jgi:hypothetical protein
MTDQTPTPGTSSHRTLADYFAGTPRYVERPAPRTVYAAVIEWAFPFDDTATDLILERSEDARLTEIKRAIRAEYEARQEGGSDEWDEDLEDIAHGESAATLSEWLEVVAWPLQDGSGGPTISTYEREV